MASNYWTILLEFSWANPSALESPIAWELFYVDQVLFSCDLKCLTFQEKSTGRFKFNHQFLNDPKAIYEIKAELIILIFSVLPVSSDLHIEIVIDRQRTLIKRFQSEWFFRNIVLSSREIPDPIDAKDHQILINLIVGTVWEIIIKGVIFNPLLYLQISV